VLALEAEALQNARRAAVAAGADLAARIDHAVPRYPTAIIERAQGVADKPRLAAESGELCDLAVSCHPTPWNSRDDCVDPFVATRRGRHQRKCIGMLARLRERDREDLAGVPTSFRLLHGRVERRVELHRPDRDRALKS